LLETGLFRRQWDVDRLLRAIWDGDRRVGQRQARLPEPLHKVDGCKIIEGRKYDFDFVYPDLMVAIEVDGGTWKRTNQGRSAGHAHPARITHDNEKRNLARLLGWRVFQFDTTAINSGQALDVIRQLLKP
jgi:very-short-patch-repair endonuclease